MYFLVGKIFWLSRFSSELLVVNVHHPLLNYCRRWYFEFRSTICIFILFLKIIYILLEFYYGVSGVPTRRYLRVPKVLFNLIH
jgi:hypothetical protein